MDLSVVEEPEAVPHGPSHSIASEPPNVTATASNVEHLLVADPLDLHGDRDGRRIQTVLVGVRLAQLRHRVRVRRTCVRTHGVPLLDCRRRGQSASALNGANRNPAGFQAPATRRRSREGEIVRCRRVRPSTGVAVPRRAARHTDSRQVESQPTSDRTSAQAGLEQDGAFAEHAANLAVSRQTQPVPRAGVSTRYSNLFSANFGCGARPLSVHCGSGLPRQRKGRAGALIERPNRTARPTSQIPAATRDQTATGR